MAYRIGPPLSSLSNGLCSAGDAAYGIGDKAFQLLHSVPAQGCLSNLLASTPQYISHSSLLLPSCKLHLACLPAAWLHLALDNKSAAAIRLHITLSPWVRCRREGPACRAA